MTDGTHHTNDFRQLRLRVLASHVLAPHTSPRSSAETISAYGRLAAGTLACSECSAPERLRVGRSEFEFPSPQCDYMRSSNQLLQQAERGGTDGRHAAFTLRKRLGGYNYDWIATILLLLPPPPWPLLRACRCCRCRCRCCWNATDQRRLFVLHTHRRGRVPTAEEHHTKTSCGKRSAASGQGSQGKPGPGRTPSSCGTCHACERRLALRSGNCRLDGVSKTVRCVRNTVW